MDVLSRDARSALMSRIRSTDTQPELIVRRLLHRLGYRFRIHDRRLPGTPDIVLPKYRAVVFVHGCFWHRHAGCQLAYTPKSRRSFWKNKFLQNVRRDQRNRRRLRSLGWRAFVVWQCETGDTDLLATRISQALESCRNRSIPAKYPKHSHRLPLRRELNRLNSAGRRASNCCSVRDCKSNVRSN